MPPGRGKPLEASRAKRIRGHIETFQRAKPELLRLVSLPCLWDHQLARRWIAKGLHPHISLPLLISLKTVPTQPYKDFRGPLKDLCLPINVGSHFYGARPLVNTGNPEPNQCTVSCGVKLPILVAPSTKVWPVEALMALCKFSVVKCTGLILGIGQSTPQT